MENEERTGLTAAVEEEKTEKEEEELGPRRLFELSSVLL